MRLAHRLLPHPWLSLTILLVWMMLVNRFAWGSLVFAAILGLVIPAAISVWWPNRSALRRPWRLPGYVAVVMWDIVKANIAVARIVLFMPRAELRPCWLPVPLRLTSPEALAILAGTITLTPGTVTCGISEDGRHLLVHCLHAPDPDAVREEIIDRYESRLLEIFA